MMKIQPDCHADQSSAANPSLLANFIEAMNRIDRRPVQSPRQAGPIQRQAPPSSILVEAREVPFRANADQPGPVI
jgi:hypothetical protein